MTYPRPSCLNQLDLCILQMNRMRQDRIMPQQPMSIINPSISPTPSSGSEEGLGEGYFGWVLRNVGLDPESGLRGCESAE